MIIYRKVIVKKYTHYTHKTWDERFLKIIFLRVCDTRSFFAWIRIRNEFFPILDPDPFLNDTDPPQWLQQFIILTSPILQDRIRRGGVN